MPNRNTHNIEKVDYYITSGFPTENSMTKKVAFLPFSTTHSLYRNLLNYSRSRKVEIDTFNFRRCPQQITLTQRGTC